MAHKQLSSACCLGLILSLFACSSPRGVVDTGKDTSLPGADREFRAAWVATVANINWPSKPGLSTGEQQQEAIQLLDLLQRHHFNAVILQVRTQADALYPSELEPWSYFLSGEEGRAPEPFYDPLAFWIEAAHDRGLELHVWLNPYRAHHPRGGELTDASIVRKYPGLVVELKDGYWWLDPTLPGTQALTTAVVMDLVRRYDIDGVHFDDYFYPYPSYNGNEDFPDDKSWAAYRQGSGRLSRNDWRREGVNTLISNLYRKIKAEKPYVKFGLSPFGIWRPGYPASIKGFDQYDQLYADARLWLTKGWIDYWTPQLYWPINQIPQSYPVLLGWWKDQNLKNRHIWPGINIGRIRGEKGVDETINQIMITRGMVPAGPGNVHWSIGPLVRSDTLANALSEGPYQQQALVPASPWLDRRAPDPPVLSTRTEGDSLILSWSHPNEKDVFHWVVYFQYGETWEYRILNRKDHMIALPRERPAPVPPAGPAATTGTPASPQALGRVMVSAADRSGNESRPTEKN